VEHRRIRKTQTKHSNLDDGLTLVCQKSTTKGTKKIKKDR